MGGQALASGRCSSLEPQPSPAHLEAELQSGKAACQLLEPRESRLPDSQASLQLGSETSKQRERLGSPEAAGGRSGSS